MTGDRSVSKCLQRRYGRGLTANKNPCLFCSSMYFFGLVWCFAALLFLPGGKPKTHKKDKENTQATAEEKDEQNNSTTDEFIELRHRVNKKIEAHNRQERLLHAGARNSLLKENLMWGLRLLRTR